MIKPSTGIIIFTNIHLSTNMKMRKYLLASLMFVSLSQTAAELNVDRQLKYCETKVANTIKEISRQNDCNYVPWHILKGQKQWALQKVTRENWTSGFWAGLLWYDYEATGNGKVKAIAKKYTDALTKLADMPVYDHDLGFLIFCANGNAFRLTGKNQYKQMIIRSADSLATLFNPRVGTILSWPREVKPRNWPHNTIMDNMINLEMLFRGAELSGNSQLYHIATRHAETTMKNNFRKDYTSYHVAVYDTVDGHFIKGVTHQGYADNSMWARGQSWAIYGFTMVYRETKEKKYLDFVQKVADVYIKRLPKDLIPYWDFDDPKIPNAPKDVSAACITASALIELSTYLPDKKGTYYRNIAKRMLSSISTNTYLSNSRNSAMLMHSTGNLPAGSEIDASLIYADYYYMEALIRLKHLTK
jgi:unsaturated chondroitin disaccharide hydrolase